MTRSLKFSSRKNRPAPRPPRARLEIEALEERTLLSVTPIDLSEFLVNQNAAQFQQDTFDQKLAVAVVPTGGFVVAYRSFFQDGDRDGIFARVFDANRNPLTDEFQVNTFTSNDQYAPAVAVAPDGSFLIAYTSIGQEDPSLPFSNGVFARRFDAAGNPLGAEFLVNTTTFLGQSFPSLGFAADGSFVIAWQSFNQDGDGFGIYAQRYSADGTKAGGEIQVNATTTGDQESPALAVGADGSFVVTWDGLGHQSSIGIDLSVIRPGGGDEGPPPSTGPDVDKGIFARVFTANGKPLTDEIQVSGFSGGNQQAASVAMAPDGSVFIVWQSTGQDSPNSDGVFARLFAANGLTAEFQVNSSAPYFQRYPTVAADAQGNFLVTYSSFAQDGSGWSIYARQFSSTGDPLGDEFLVNTVTRSDQVDSSVAIDGSGTAVIVYSGNGPSDQPGVFDRQGVFARTFSVDSAAAGDFNQAPEVGLDGLYSFNSIEQTGIINQAGDRDIFQFLATVDARQTIRFDTASTLTGVLQVFDSQQAVAVTDIPGGVAFDVVQGETYYVAVTGASNSTGAYLLTFGPSRNSPRNGSLTASGPAAVPPSLGVPQQLTDRLDADAARDGFTPALMPLVVDQNGRLSAGLHTDGFAARLSLFDAQGNLLIQSVGQSPANHDPLLLQQLTGDDFGTRYYLEVERLGAGGTGLYTLTTRLQPAGDPLQPVSVGHAAASFVPESVVTADFNGDGIADVATGDIGSGTVAIFLGNGDGSMRFAGQVQIDPSSGAFPIDLLAADFNRDGKMDLAVVDSTDGDTNHHDVSILLGNGDGTFQTPKFLPVGGSQSILQSAAVGDFDGDGILDLAVTDKTFDLVHVYLGNGDGTFRFAPPPFVALDTADAFLVPYGVVSADLNHDGILDLAVTVTDFFTSQGSVVIWLGHDDGTGHGDGTFDDLVDIDGNPVRFGVGFNPYQLEAADFDKDGNTDLVVVNDGSRNLSVLLGNGDGSFTDGGTVLLHGSGPIGLVVTDFNRDGNLDVAVNDGANFVDVLLGDGHGHFQSAPGAGGFSVGDVPFDLAAADLNRDGIPDLVTADDTGKDVSISLGNGDGTFHSPALIDVGVGGYDVAAGNVNGDGLLDVVTANPASGDVTLLLGSGSGTFRDGGRLAVGSVPYSVLLVDVNKDSKLDIVTANAGSNNVSVLLGNGDGTFQAEKHFDTGGMMGDDRGVLAAGDFNGDGVLDLAVANGVSGDVSILLGNGDGTFGLAGRVAVGGRPSGVVAADLDGNGSLDLAVATGAAGDVVVLLNNGNGTFRVGQRVAVGGRARALAAADLNGDGKLDVAVAVDAADGKGLSQAVVLLNNGNGTLRLADQRYSLEGFGATAIRAADVTGDGKSDLVVTESGSASVGVLAGNGDGTFGPVHRLRAGERPWGVAIGDFDKDGRPDLAVSDPFTATVTVVAGLGSGAFQTERTALLGTSPVALASGDFNNDGQQDVVAANFGSGDVSVLLGNGDGSFEEGRRVPVGRGPKALVAADFNQDGRLDLAVVDQGDNDVTLLLGNGDGTFQLVGRIAVGRAPTSLVVVDLNHDGKLDLVAGSSVDSSLTVLLGKGDGSFQAPTMVPLPSPAMSVAVGDLDKDGVPDLAVLDLAASGTFSDQVTVLLGNGNGTFHEQTTPLDDGTGNLAPLLIGSGTNQGTVSVSVMIAQLTDDNGDGKIDDQDNPDLVTVDLGNNTSTIFVGAGNGTFVRDPQLFEGILNTLGRPVALAVADLDGDGFPDLVSASASQNVLDIEFGDGTGFFPFFERLSASVAPVAVLALDLNGDGHPDIVTANRDSGDLSVSLGLGDGSGGFFPADQGTAPRRATPLTADFDNDGTPDVAVLARDGTILLRRGVAGTPGAFQPPEPVNPGQPARDLVQLFNRRSENDDGARVVLAALDIRSPTVSLYTLDKASGQFRRTAGPTLSDKSLLPVRLAAGDLNGDGRDDLVMIAAGPGTSSRAFVYLQNADGTFPADPTFPLPTGASPADVTLADLDGDGRLDIVVTNRYSGDVSVFLNKVNAPFAEEQRYRAGVGLYTLGEQVEDFVSPPTVRSRQGTVAVVAGQFNGDGTADLLVLNRDAGAGSVLFGDGAGGLFNPSAGFTFNAGGDPTAVVRADFDRDGRPDLAVLDSAAGAVRIFRGLADGTFAPGAVIPVGLFASGLSVTDVVDPKGGPPDGMPDLLVGTEQGDILILAGDGMGNFTQFRRRGQIVSLAVADLNGDGVMDALTANQSKDQAAVQVRQPGTTTLTTVTVDSTDAGPGNIQYQDVNADGIPDRIVVNSAGNSIQVFLGQGGGTFGPASSSKIFGAGTNPINVLFAQLNDDNGDGKINGSDFLDLLVVNHGSNDLSVLFGSGTGAGWTLTPGPRLTTGSGPVAVLPVQDVDVRGLTGNQSAPGLDGIPDLRIVNQDGSITVLPGIGTAAGTGFFLDALSPLFLNTGAPTIRPSQLVLPPGGEVIQVLPMPNGSLVDLTNLGTVIQVTPGAPAQQLFASLPGSEIRFLTSFGSDFFGATADGRIVQLTSDPEGGLAADPLIGSLAGLSQLQIVQGAAGLEAYVTVEGDSMARVFELGRVDQGGLTAPPLLGPEVSEAASAVASALEGAGTRLVQALLPATLTDRTAAEEGSEEGLFGLGGGTGFQPSNPSLRQGDGESDAVESNLVAFYWRLLKEALEIPAGHPRERVAPVSVLFPQLAEALTVAEQGVETTASAAVEPLVAASGEVLATLRIDLPAVAAALPPSLAEFPRELVEALDRSFEAVGDDLLQRFIKGQKSEDGDQESEVRGQPSGGGRLLTSDSLTSDLWEEETGSNQETVLGDEEAASTPASIAPIPVEQWVKASLVAAGGWLALWHGRDRKKPERSRCLGG